MHVVPVIDLKDRIVVHAKRGRRERYAPLVSTLFEGSDPATAVDALLELHAFSSFYVADLNAIAGDDGNAPILRELIERFARVSFLIDRGLEPLPPHPEAEARRVCAVYGSESLPDIHALGRLDAGALSLDFKGAAFLGPPELLRRTDLWPERIIVLDLARVGSGAGPDYARLQAIRAAVPDRRLYAGGGVRSAADLQRLAAIGIDGALVASALHDGSIGGRDLAAVSA